MAPDSDSDDSDSNSDDEGDFGFQPPSLPQPSTLPSHPSTASFGFPSTASTTSSSRPNLNPTKLFTSEELSILPSGVLDRQKAKQAAKKAKKRQMEKERTEGELMNGILGMEVEQTEPIVLAQERKNKKERKREKRKAELEARRSAGITGPPSSRKRETDQGSMMVEDEGSMARKKEEEFERFLQGVGADMDEDL